MTSLDLPAEPRILVVTLRRLGDALLTTPLVRTLRRGFPRARLDLLVFSGSDGILKGNPDIDNVLTMSERPSAGETLALVRALWRRYDLAVSTQAGDRPTFFAMVAGRRRVGLVPRAGETGAWWKRHAHHVPVTAVPDCHRVTQLSALATALGLAPATELVCPEGGAADEVAHALLEDEPPFRYRRPIPPGLLAHACFRWRLRLRLPHNSRTSNGTQYRVRGQRAVICPNPPFRRRVARPPSCAPYRVDDRRNRADFSPTALHSASGSGTRTDQHRMRAPAHP